MFFVWNKIMQVHVRFVFHLSLQRMRMMEYAKEACYCVRRLSVQDTVWRLKRRGGEVEGESTINPSMVNINLNYM